MKALIKAIAITLAASSTAFAAGSKTEDAGLLVYLFAGFFAVIIITQLVPAAILLFGMIKGVFSTDSKSSVAKSK